MQNLGMLLSIVVPAFNEERYLGETLASLNRAKAFLEQEPSYQAEIIVVDNDSDDSTANVARALGATVATEALHNIAKVRNTGARSSNGDVIVFVDADTLVPENLLSRIVEAMSDDNCFGGAVDCDYRPMKAAVRAYLQFWRIIGRLTGMAQGATQFCRKDVFFKLNGYDETLFMGEDVDLYWRLKKFARRRNCRVAFINDIRVIPSTRRFEQWQFWRTLLWTNPLLIFMFRRNRAFWRGWYRAAPR
jgi:glycosyltransferase involved in cell wall biosynthesis